MSFILDSRVQAAIELVKGASAVSNRFSEDQVIKFLEDETSGSLSALRHISYEKIKDFFSVTEAFARAFADLLRPKKSPSKEDLRETRIKALNASEANPDDLVAEVAKKPLQRNSRFFTALRRLVGNKPVMVWEGDVVNVEETVSRVKDVISSKRLREIVTLNGKPIVPLALGVGPDNIELEHPLFPDETLYGDGTGEDGNNWSSLPHNTKLFLAFLVSREELNVKSGDPIQISQIFRMAEDGSIFQTYQRAVVEFEQIASKKRLHIFSSSKGRVSRLSQAFG